jgi:hypothetical protein
VGDPNDYLNRGRKYELQVDSEGDSVVVQALLTPSVVKTGEEGWKPWRLSLFDPGGNPFAHDFFKSFKQAAESVEDWVSFVLSEWWWYGDHRVLKHDFNRDIDSVAIVSAEDYTNESMKTQCQACGHEFNYVSIPESQVGSVECPSCCSTVDQAGQVFERELTSKARKALPKGQFVFPKERRYPIHDLAHARNALSRVSQFGTPSEKARVRAAVRRKFPNIGKDTAEESIARICGRPLGECSGRCTGCGRQRDDLDHFGKGQLLCKRCSAQLRESIEGEGPSIVEKICIVLLKDPEVGKCAKCGVESQELRPYGEGGALICFKCGMEDEPGTSKRFLDLFHSAIEAANNFEKQRMLIDPYPHLKASVNG